MKKTILILVLFLCACTDVDGATKAIEDMGMTPTKVGGYGYFSCSDKDTFSTKFEAVNANNRPVKVVVCSGWLKGATVRTF